MVDYPLSNLSVHAVHQSYEDPSFRRGESPSLLSHGVKD